ncbi:MAG: 4-alpha-glucanotransferase [Kastovskya adunca ATA6-11-RM4]|jgi:4-alpha-glucanotransferase|nr:4-alpha-glucanotransferase [Kastovskya adunca ATA6-11-RM4]
MPFPRSSGVLLHPTSLPSQFGIGDLGLEAFRFVDFLAEGGQTLWQVLPLGPTGYGHSPYMSYSAMAGNPLLISPDKLRDQGLLSDDDFQNLPEFPLEKVDYDRVIQTKMPLLRKAGENFKAQATPLLQTEFAGFCDSKASWLDDYALFMALREVHEGQSWHTWEPELAHRQPEALEEWRQRLDAEIQYHKYLQFQFFRQWSELKLYANMRGIQIIGDIPIYVAHDSAEVWAHRDMFCLDEKTGEPSLMAGVPPDYFSATGQLWGNPVYNWDHLQETHFQWWVQRFEMLLDYVDIIRIDHFRGFEAYWAVKRGESTALNGEWMKAPGETFFEVLKGKLGQLPIVAEDLGTITPEVHALREQFEFPGMKILQFAFGEGPDNPYLPFSYERNCMVYTGTHDNDTIAGWYSEFPEEKKESLVRYLGCTSPDGIHWDFIRLAMASVGNQVIIPLQDILGLGTEARMNFPSKAEGNWEWRYQPGTLTKELSDRVHTLTYTYGRLRGAAS